MQPRLLGKNLSSWRAGRQPARPKGRRLFFILNSLGDFTISVESAADNKVCAKKTFPLHRSMMSRTSFFSGLGSNEGAGRIVAPDGAQSQRAYRQGVQAH